MKARKKGRPEGSALDKMSKTDQYARANKTL
jgi:hypothetical protein